MQISDIDFLNSIADFPQRIQKLLTQSVPSNYIDLPGYEIVKVDATPPLNSDFILTFCNQIVYDNAQGFSISVSSSYKVTDFWEWKIATHWTENKPGKIRIVAGPWKASLLSKLIGTTIAPGLCER